MKYSDIVYYSLSKVVITYKHRNFNAYQEWGDSKDGIITSLIII